jgi:hypothetical protein
MLVSSNDKDLILYVSYYESGLLVIKKSFAQAILDGVSISKTSGGVIITMNGSYDKPYLSTKIVYITNAVYVMDINGKASIRIAGIDPYIRVGARIIYRAYDFTADEVSCNIEGTSQYMTINQGDLKYG